MFIKALENVFALSLFKYFLMPCDTCTVVFKCFLTSYNACTVVFKYFLARCNGCTVVFKYFLVRCDVCTVVFKYFLARCDACTFAFCFSSMVIPSRRAWDLSILFPSRSRFTLILVFVPNIISWNLLGFGFQEFILNHFRICPKSNLKLHNISPNIFPQDLSVLSSAKLYMSDF